MKRIRVRIIMLAKPGKDLVIIYEGNLVSLVWRDHEPNFFVERLEL